MFFIIIFKEIKSSIKIYNNNFKVRINKEKKGQLYLFLQPNTVDISILKIIEDR
jgi:hypothetical protein